VQRCESAVFGPDVLPQHQVPPIPARKARSREQACEEKEHAGGEKGAVRSHEPSLTSDLSACLGERRLVSFTGALHEGFFAQAPHPVW
jgi:hypothetical protein